MTTIIGVQLEHGCIVVSDSRIAASGKVYTHPDMVKAVQRGNYVIAGAGDYRALQVVLHGWTPPVLTIKAKENLYEFMINKVVPMLKTTLTAAGIELSKSSDDSGNKFELSLLIAVNGIIITKRHHRFIFLNKKLSRRNNGQWRNAPKCAAE
jgi:hypothetical protein